MKRLILVDSIVCKYPSILIGLLVAAASMFPLAAPAVAAPTISITKASLTKSIVTGNNATYTITVSNTATGSASNDTAHKLAISDTLPDGFKYGSEVSITKTGTAATSAVTSKPAIGESNLNWKISTIPPNSSITITFTASTIGVTAKKYDNSVDVTYYRTISNANNNNNQKSESYNGYSNTADDVTIEGLPPNLTVTNTSLTKSIPIGENATYNITVTNTGAGAASNVNVIDVLPAGFKYGTQVSIVPTGTAAASAVTSTPALGDTNLNWNISTIPASSSITISFTASTAGVAAGKYNNSVNAEYYATGSSVKKTASYDGSTGTTEDVTLTPLSNLTVTNTSPTDSIPIGENATYTITVENNGAGAASNVKLSDVLPAGFKYGTQVSIVPTGTAAASAVTSTPALGATNLNWDILTIPANSSITISFTASTAGVALGKYNNSVNAEYYTTGSSVKQTAAYDGDTGTTEDVTITPLPNLTVTNATMSGYIANGSTAIYQITVKNESEGKAYNVKISDALPAGFRYDKELVILTKGAVTPSATKSYVKPVSNDTAPKWENYDIPGKGIVTIFFTATGNISPTATTAQKFDNSVNVAYTSTPASTSTLTASYDGASSTADDVIVKPKPPQPTLGTASRSAAAIESTPRTYCGGEPGAAGIGANITGIVNTYFRPALKTVAAGTNKIDIVDGAAKGMNQDIKPGDLLLILQMQDATITNANNDTYGSGSATNQGSGQTSMGTTGLYEYATADSVITYANGGTQLNLKKPLINSYVSSAATTNSGQKRFQVIRVPQYASVTVLGTLYAAPWDGNVGGVLAIDTFGKFNLNNQRMSANSVGFRGGFGRQNSYQNALNGYVSPLDSTLGAGKGEGTAGTPRFISTQEATYVDPATGVPQWTGGYSDNIIEGYPGGDTGIGAPANAGGAGNYHNAGGGGGGNGGIGGQGGLSWSNGTDFVPFETGGRPGSLSSVNNLVPWQLIMGGGGGGGEANNSPQGVPGGAGGGIVMLRAGEIVGSGQIFANGRDGDRGAYDGAPDGAGGAGAGGTVLIQSRNATSANLTIEAKGGNGGSTERDALYDYRTGSVSLASQDPNQSVGYTDNGYPFSHTPHGPGGGGAGGVVLYNFPGGTVNANVTGGVAGQTDDIAADAAYAAVSGKTRNTHGATAGSRGIERSFSNSEDPFNSLNNVTDCSAQLILTNKADTPKVRQGEIAKFTITVENKGNFGSAIDVDINSPLLAGFTYSKTDSIVLTNGTAPATRSTTPSNPAANSTTPSWGKFTIPAGGKVEISYQVLVGRNVAVGDYDNTAISSFPDPLRDAANPNAKIENRYDEKSSREDNIEVTKARSTETVWNVSPTIRIVRK
jgi:uncharacterized repeat protein (TIGR01451 family)